MKHLTSAAARAAPLHGLLAAAALCAMADQKQGAKTAPTLAPAATDLDTGQPQAIAFDAKKHGARTQHLRRDSAGPPIGTAHSQHLVGGGVHKAKSGGHHRQRVVALN